MGRVSKLTKFNFARFLDPEALSKATVFPRNLAAATFNFMVQFGAATF